MAETDKMCESHAEAKAFFYCMNPDCRKFICAQCVTTAHKDHNTFYCKAVDEAARGKIIAELEKAGNKKAKALETTEMIIGDTHASLRSELEDVVFNSKYITILRQKLKDYENHIQDLNEKNKNLQKDNKEMTRVSNVETKKLTEDLQSKIDELASCRKKIDEQTEEHKNMIQKMRDEGKKELIDLREVHRLEEETWRKNKDVVELENKELTKFRDSKLKIENEIKQLKDDKESLIK